MQTTVNRIDSIFKEKEDDQKLMNLFITAGYPDLNSTAELVCGFAEHGADIIELGMPFSDPLADGPTIQFSSEEAIKNGATIPYIFETVKEIRTTTQIPIILMGYLNPVMKYGIEKFCREAAEAGVDGLIIPDVPVGQFRILSEEASKNKLALVYLVAPNTSDQRMKEIDSHSQGFVYCVSVTGVTGAREGDEVAQSVKRFINRVNQNITKNPKLVGFGIKTYEDAQKIAAKADGYIVGSALIDCIRKKYPQQGWKESVYKFVRTLKHGPNA